VLPAELENYRTVDQKKPSSCKARKPSQRTSSAFFYRYRKKKKKKKKKRLQKACSRNERKRRRHEEERDPIDTKEAPMAMVVAGKVRERKTPGKQYLLLLLKSRNK
jgi:hypothetical protein